MCACGQAISLSKGLVTCKGVLKRWHEFRRQPIQIQCQLLKFSDILQFFLQAISPISSPLSCEGLLALRRLVLARSAFGPLTWTENSWMTSSSVLGLRPELDRGPPSATTEIALTRIIDVWQAVQFRQNVAATSGLPREAAIFST